MELYVLDQSLRRIACIDRFESLIWTERMRAWGDFDLNIPASSNLKDLLAPGTRVALNESQYVMTVENFETKNNADGKRMLSISGRSLESLMEARVGASNLSPNSSMKWPINGSAGAIVRYMFSKICVEGLIDVKDKIPFIQTGTLTPAGNIPEPAEYLTTLQEVGPLYKQIKDLCDAYNLGFRIIKDVDNSKLYFEVYAGNNRTSLQTTLPAVIFSQGMGTLQNTTELTSIAAYKNVAYVYAQNGFGIVYADGVDPNESGFQRRVLHVKADNITTAAGATLNAEIQARGKLELTKHRTIQAFDGETPKQSPYKYNVDYQLGDLVEIRNDAGASNQMRVTEQIFVSDHEGDKSYPTLALETFILPGTWAAWDANQIWDDALMEWEDASA